MADEDLGLNVEERALLRDMEARLRHENDENFEKLPDPPLVVGVSGVGSSAPTTPSASPARVKALKQEADAWITPGGKGPARDGAYGPADTVFTMRVDVSNASL